MKPTIENIRKIVDQLTDPQELTQLRDNIAFYIAGVRETALYLSLTVNDVETLLDKARAADDYISSRLRTLEHGGAER